MLCSLFKGRRGRLRDPRRGWPAKNLHTKSKRLTLRCRVSCAWSVNSTGNDNYRERKKKMQRSQVLGPLPDGRAPVICPVFPPHRHCFSPVKNVCEVLWNTDYVCDGCKLDDSQRRHVCNYVRAKIYLVFSSLVQQPDSDLGCFNCTVL